MIEEIFNELFGDVDFTKAFDSYQENEKETDENGKNYYHLIRDEYEDGKRVSHVEKEVRDGKVIKDINEKPMIEGKKCERNKDGAKKCNEYDKIKKEYNALEEKYRELYEEYNNVFDELNNLRTKIKDLL